ncbi:PspC domain-containing protein [Acinetobacter haemolyticus]|uniref:PspC domain-containing protein n=1 Tax=Acinetobacter haemolyticus TaxID=29430 RepID=UPI0013737533|nr:PspC domain-containing protein [Acinetobacter haemolyticus]NAR90700.1 PspC domain-containing protein [Acinetobacter haemolyticus]
MQFVINNPYRILGLTANASSREVAKRVADLETFAEFGKIKKYPLDLVEIVPLTRTVDTIQQAAKDIENDTDKLVYAFFWFAKVDSVDELAIECIENNQVQKAFEIWDQQISKNENDAKFSWRLNRAVISLFWCQGSNFDTDNFESALKDLGYLTDDHFQDVQRFVFGESNLKIDIEQVNRKIIDETLKFVSNLEEQPYGAYGIGLSHEFWTFSTSAQNYVQTKLFAPCINQIETAIQKSQQLRDAENSNSINQYNGLKEVEDLIYEIDEFSENYKIQSVINEYANEVRRCSLYAYNQIDNRDLAYELITWAEELPSYGQVAQDIEKNKEELVDLIENDKFEEIYATITDYIKRDLHSIDDARKVLNVFKIELAKVDVHNEMYYTVSSYCVTKILNFLIDEFNEASDRLERDKNLESFYRVAVSVRDVMAQLRNFEKNSEVKERLENNYQSISSQADEANRFLESINRNVSSSHSNDNSTYPSTYREPGFYKSDKDIVFSGALGGLAELWGWNAGFLRILFVVVSVFTSIWPGVIAYIVLNMIMPKRN